VDPVLSAQRPLVSSLVLPSYFLILPSLSPPDTPYFHAHCYSHLLVLAFVVDISFFDLHGTLEAHMPRLPFAHTYTLTPRSCSPALSLLSRRLCSLLQTAGNHCTRMFHRRVPLSCLVVIVLLCLSYTTKYAICRATTDALLLPMIICMNTAHCLQYKSLGVKYICRFPLFTQRHLDPNIDDNLSFMEGLCVV
jgi:hypothetical protein